jgi:hypothetical protein
MAKKIEQEEILAVEQYAENVVGQLKSISKMIDYFILQIDNNLTLDNGFNTLAEKKYVLNLRRKYFRYIFVQIANLMPKFGGAFTYQEREGLRALKNKIADIT